MYRKRARSFVGTKESAGIVAVGRAAVGIATAPCLLLLQVIY